MCLWWVHSWPCQCGARVNNSEAIFQLYRGKLAWPSLHVHPAPLLLPAHAASPPGAVTCPLPAGHRQGGWAVGSGVRDSIMYVAKQYRQSNDRKQFISLHSGSVTSCYILCKFHSCLKILPQISQINFIKNVVSESNYVQNVWRGSQYIDPPCIYTGKSQDCASHL